MPKRPIRAEDLLKIQFVGDPQISPDGFRVLYSKKHINDKNKYITNLFSVDMNGAVQQWTQGEGGAGMGRWSPDGSQIAFVSGREGKKGQIFLIPTSGGEARKLTDLPEGSLGEFKWSPDGKRIAFIFREESEDRTEKAKKEREEKGESSAPWVLDSPWYRLDGDGYFGMQRHAIYIAETDSGETKKLYDQCPFGFYSFDWSPNSKELAFTRSMVKNVWGDKPDDQIFRMDMDGQAVQVKGLPKGEKGSIAWSPDGKTLAFLGDATEDDPWGIRNVKLYTVPIGGGKPKCLSDKEDYCLNAATLGDTKEGAGEGKLFWSPDSKAIYINVGWHGASQLGFVQVDKGGVELLTEGQHYLAVGNLSANGERFGALWGDAMHLMEIGVYDLSAKVHLKVLTHENKKWHADIKLSEPEEVWVKSPDGWMVHAWVIKPIDYLEPKRYPAVLEIHGGPHTQYGWTCFHEFQLLAAQGYVVVYSNPRGSKGYGEAHCAAIRGAWGDRDWEDIHTVMKWMQAQPYIHPGQMGVMGGSYGGYMTNWVVGHTNEFKAAITDRCVSNFVSMNGSSDFPINKDGYWKGYAWGDAKAIKELWEQSPISHFDKVKTPMLIIHSEGDLRCNIEQSEQVFSALQAQGIESRFVRYPQNTSHGLSRNGPPDMRLHRLAEIVRWWEKHLK